jgi:hypothetical protein
MKVKEKIKTVLDKPYVTTKNGKHYLPNVAFECFSSECLKNSKKLAYLNYASLIRFYLYVWLLKYDGDDAWVNYVKDTLNDPSSMSYHRICRILNQMGTNNIIMNFFNRQNNLNLKTTYDKDITILTKMDEKKNNIFTDMNFREVTSIIGKLTDNATNSEDSVRFFLKKVWAKYFKIEKPTDDEDIKGIDLWRINKSTGDRERLQVKNMSKITEVKIVDNMITITPSNIALNNYIFYSDTLKYDYLILYNKFKEKVHIINGKAISEIKKNHTKIIIIMKEWDPKYKAIREYDLPKKFL